MTICPFSLIFFLIQWLHHLPGFPSKKSQGCFGLIPLLYLLWSFQPHSKVSSRSSNLSSHCHYPILCHPLPNSLLILPLFLVCPISSFFQYRNCLSQRSNIMALLKNCDGSSLLQESSHSFRKHSLGTYCGSGFVLDAREWGKGGMSQFLSKELTIQTPLYYSEDSFSSSGSPYHLLQPVYAPMLLSQWRTGHSQSMPFMSGLLPHIL